MNFDFSNKNSIPPLVLCQDLAQIKISFLILTCLQLRICLMIQFFKIIRRHIIAMTMNPFSIIKCFHLFKHQTIFADLKVVQPFSLYQWMKGFNTGIIPGKGFLDFILKHFSANFLYHFVWNTKHSFFIITTTIFSLNKHYPERSKL